MTIAAVFTAGIVNAADADPVLDRIAKVELFALGGVGFSMVTSPGEKDYDLIMVRPPPRLGTAAATKEKSRFIT